MTSPSADSSSVDANAAAADARGKRPAWNALSNGSTEVGPVMGAVSWPALSESAKASPKSPSSDSLKSLSDASSLAAPGIPQAPLISSPTAKHTASSSNPNPIQNPMPSVRQKSIKRGGSSGGGAGSESCSLANGGLAPPQQLALATDNVGSAPDKQTVLEPSPKGFKAAGGPAASHLGGPAAPHHGGPAAPHHGGPATPHYGGPDQHRGYGGNRRGNNGGSPHQNHINRRDQDWNHPRGLFVQQPRGVIRPYPRQLQPVSPTYIAPLSPVRPFGNAIYPDFHSMCFVGAHSPHPEAIRGMPFGPQPIPQQIFIPTMDPLCAQLLVQIDYYFSSENLSKDLFLRRNMDEQGWVPVSLIASFNRVKLLTNNIQYILDTVRLSNFVEVQGDKIRRRNDWMSWLMPSGPQSPNAADYDTVTAHLRNVSLEGGPIQREGLVLTGSASGNINSEDPNGEGNDDNDRS